MHFLPITALYAGLLGILLLFLSIWVVTFRWRRKIGIGDDGSREMQRAIRVHANFTEYVPTVLILMAINELGGESPLWIHGLGATLLIGRLLHALGLSRNSGVSAGRFLGSTLTFTSLGISAVLCLLRGLG